MTRAICPACGMVQTKSPMKNTREIAEHLRFVCPDGSPNLRKTERWLKRHGVPTKCSGRDLTAHIDDVNAKWAELTARRRAA